MRLNLKQKATAILLVPFLIQIAFFLLYNQCMLQAERQAAQEHRSKNVIGHANWFSTVVCTATLSLTSYVRTKQLRYLANYRSEISKTEKELTTLRGLLVTDPEQRKNCQNLSVETHRYMARLRAIEDLSRVDMGAAADAMHGPAFMKSFNGVFRARSQLLATERKHQGEQPMLASQTRKWTEGFIAFGIISNVCAALALVILFSRNIAHRLEVLTDNTVRLARKQQLNPPCEGEDEIAHLDREFHAMAENLEAAIRRERVILENATEVICSLDSYGRFTEINQACLEAWGYEPADLIGKCCVEIVSPQSQEKTASALIQGAKTNEKFTFENEIVREDGEFMIIRWSTYWSAREQTYFCVAHDVSQQRHIERLKSQFMNMVSHDLKTPLASIHSFFELLMSGAYEQVPPACINPAAQAQRNTKRLIKLTEDLLDLERLESGAFPLELDYVDIRHVVDEAISSVRPVAIAAGVIIDDAHVYPHFIKVDGGRITQVVVNLLSNAIKFSESGSMVHIATNVHQGHLELLVADSGRGIPAHLKSLLFDRFKQVEIRDARRGSGLGLAICKNIIDQHGGKIGVDSELGQGSRFWISIPSAEVDHVPEETPADLGTETLDELPKIDFVPASAVDSSTPAAA